MGVVAEEGLEVPTDITEDTIRELALPLGFVDVKVCAVSEVWSGLKPWSSGRSCADHVPRHDCAPGPATSRSGSRRPASEAAGQWSCLTRASSPLPSRIGS